MRRLTRVVVTLLIVALMASVDAAVGPGTAPVPGSSPQIAQAQADGLGRTRVGRVLVVSANVKEGNAGRTSARDIARAADRKRFVARLLKKVPAAPDMMLLQEALGSTSRITRLLNWHPRIGNTRSRYRVAVRPRLWPGGRRCDGHRNYHRDVRRDVSIVINTATTAGPVNSGRVRTWGAYPTPRSPDGARRACKEHVWALFREKDGRAAGRFVRVMNAHPAPAVRSLKTAAMRKITNRMVQLQRRTRRGLAVIGGDFNLTRCKSDPETRSCGVREAHRYLHDKGYRDAIRTINPTGTGGVVGVRSRIDHIYVNGGVRNSWFARCYKAFNVTRPRCPANKAVFSNRRIFLRCDRLATLGKGPARPCGPKRYQRYYSDHYALWANATWPSR